MVRALEQFLNIQDAVMLLTAIAAFATILTVALPFMRTNKLGTRMKHVATEREALRQHHFAELSRERTRLRMSPKGFMKQFVEQLNLNNMLENEKIKLKLRRAGFRGPGPMYTFLFFRFIMPPALFLITVLYLFFINDFGLVKPMSRIAASCAAAFVGFYLPNLFVENVITRRQDNIRRSFPDALDLLLICVESGMSIEAAFNKVAAEIGSQSVEMAEELALTTAELSYLQERRKAYENLALRTGLAGVKAVVTSLIQAERYGTPLGQALRIMAQENRDIRMMEAEKKAAGLPPKLTVPMILFFLPVLFAVIIGPAAIQLSGM